METNHVEFRYNRNKVNWLIVIHNHPNSTLFSDTDLLTFSEDAKIRCLVAQCHNGVVYWLGKTAASLRSCTLTRRLLEDVYGDTLEAYIRGGNSVSSKGKLEVMELYVKAVSVRQGWVFNKTIRGESNE